MTDGTCPSCRKNTEEKPILESQTGPSSRTEKAWDAYKESEIPAISLAAGEQPRAEPAAANRLREFQQALVTCTPHLIATPLIIAANVFVFSAMAASGVSPVSPTIQSVLEWGANFGPKTMSGQWWRLVSSMFLHFGFLHILFNMWVLWDLGRLMERLVGNVGFALLYLVSGIAGSIASLAWNPNVVSAGASGAVFGVAGALVGFMAFRRDTIPLSVLKPLGSSMGAFLVYNLAFGVIMPGIDMAAHVGGLVTGFLCGLILSQPLSEVTAARRPLRNVIVLVVGAALLPVAAYSLPEAPPDVDQEMARFGRTEAAVLERDNRLARQAQVGTLADAEYAKALEEEVLPPWIEARQRMEGLLDTPYVNRRFLSELIKYMRLREESWNLRVKGLREQDPEIIELANSKWTEADRLARDVTSSQHR